MCGKKLFNYETTDGRVWGNVYPPNNPMAQQSAINRTAEYVSAMLDAVEDGRETEDSIRWVHGLCEPSQIGGGK
jgi:hypothetical protein